MLEEEFVALGNTMVKLDLTSMTFDSREALLAFVVSVLKAGAEAQCEHDRYSRDSRPDGGSW